MKDIKQIAAVTVLGLAAGVVGALLYASAASAAGGKNRIGDEDIVEGYQLCEQAGADTVVIEEDGITIVIDCEEAPGPSFPGAEDD